MVACCAFALTPNADTLAHVGVVATAPHLHPTPRARSSADVPNRHDTPAYIRTNVRLILPRQACRRCWHGLDELVGIGAARQPGALAERCQWSRHLSRQLSAPRPPTPYL